MTNIFSSISFYFKKIHICFILFLSSLLFHMGCEKEDNQVGLGIITAEDNLLVQSTDTITLLAYNEFDYPINPYNEYQLLGTFNTPFHGQTVGELITDFLPYVDSIDLSEELVADSLIWFLSYNSVTQTKETLPELSVHTLIERIDQTNANSSLNMEGKYDPVDLLDKIVFLEDTIKLYLNTSYAAQLLAPINENPEYRTDTLGAYANVSIFFDLFKGLYVKPLNIEWLNTMYSIDLKSFGSRLELYFHGKDTGKIVYRHYYTQNTALNLFQHSLPYNQTDTILNLSSLGGWRIRFEIPYLDEYSTIFSNCLINRAEIQLPVIPYNDTLISKPKKLGLTEFVNGKDYYILDDFSIEFVDSLNITSSQLLSGYPVDLAITKYSINMNSHFQENMLNSDKEKFVFHCFICTDNSYPISNNNSNYEQVRLYNSSYNKPKLIVTYTNIPKK